MTNYCLALVPASLLPVVNAAAGPIYFAGALALGGIFLAQAFGFHRDVSVPNARRVLFASLVYLPGLLALLVLDAALTAGGLRMSEIVLR